MDLYAVEFELQDFGQNVSHIVGKTYYTYDFFTDRQVYSAISRDFDFLGRQDYEFRRTPCTLAIPLRIRKQKFWYSIVNTNLQKERVTAKLRYLTEGYQEYMLPSSRYLAFSFLKPEKRALFIGKKGCLAFVRNVEKIAFCERQNMWTTLDLLYFRDYEEWKEKDILEMKITDASQRFILGQFRTRTLLDVKYNNASYKFYSLGLFLRECPALDSTE
jgi:hypothetical protein